MAENYIDKIEVDGVERPIRDTSGSVRYDAPQTLSDEQKAQAIGNINAAPGGFGLGGGSKLLTPADDLNEVWENGSYAWDAAPKNAPTVGGSLIPYCSMNVLNKGANYNMHQIAQTFEGYEIRRYYNGGSKTWSEWEWVNPPMNLGIEYRTTERYLGKPVYVKTINMGNLPGNAVKQSSFQSNNVVDKIVSVTGQCTSDSGVNMSLPYHAGSGPNWNTVIIIGATGAGTAQIVTFAEDFAGYTDACITVKYTKLAD